MNRLSSSLPWIKVLRYVVYCSEARLPALAAQAFTLKFACQLSAVNSHISIQSWPTVSLIAST